MPHKSNEIRVFEAKPSEVALPQKSDYESIYEANNVSAPKVFSEWLVNSTSSDSYGYVIKGTVVRLTAKLHELKFNSAISLEAINSGGNRIHDVALGL